MDETEDYLKKVTDSVATSSSLMANWALQAMDRVADGDYAGASAIYKAIKSAGENLEEWTYYLMVADISMPKD